MSVRTFAPRLLVCALAFSLGLAADASGSERVAVLQAMDAFYTPSALAFGVDGRTLFVANAARGERGMIEGKGAVSRVTVGADGTMTMETQHFIDSLNAPLALAVLPAACGSMPAGSIVVGVGGPWVVDVNGRSVLDERQRGIGIAFFSATDGKELGRIYLGPDSPVAKRLGHAVVEVSALAADAVGNIYLADSAGGSLVPIGPRETSPGIVKFSPAAIEALLHDSALPEQSIGFVAVPEIPSALIYSPKNDALFWATGGGLGDLIGAILCLPHGDTRTGRIVTWTKNLSVLTGIVETPKGTLLATTTEGDVMSVARERAKGRLVKFRDNLTFLSPGQPALTTLGDGRVLVIVPEPSGGDRGPWRQRLESFIVPRDL